MATFNSKSVTQRKIGNSKLDSQSVAALLDVGGGGTPGRIETMRKHIKVNLKYCYHSSSIIKYNNM